MDHLDLDVGTPQPPADFTAAGAASTLPPRPSGLQGQLRGAVLDVFADSDELLTLDAVRQQVWLRLPDDVRGSWLVLVIGGNVSAVLAHLSDAGLLVRHPRGWSSRRYQARGDAAPAAPAPHAARRAPRPGRTRESGEPGRSEPPRWDGHPPLADGWEQDPLL